MTKRIGKREAQKNATRAALLAGGIESLQDTTAHLDDIDVAKVSYGSGKSIGAFYSRWDSKRDFQLDLTEHVLGEDFDIDYTRLTDTEKLESDDVVRSWSENYYGALRSSRIIVPRLLALDGIWRVAGDRQDKAQQIVGRFYERSASCVEQSLSKLDIIVCSDKAVNVVYMGEDVLKRHLRNGMSNEVAIELIDSSIHWASEPAI